MGSTKSTISGVLATCLLSVGIAAQTSAPTPDQLNQQIVTGTQHVMWECTNSTESRFSLYVRSDDPTTYAFLVTVRFKRGDTWKTFTRAVPNTPPLRPDGDKSPAWVISYFILYAPLGEGNAPLTEFRYSVSEQKYEERSLEVQP